MGFQPTWSDPRFGAQCNISFLAVTRRDAFVLHGQAQFGRAERTPEDAAWAHKYVMILDGNTFSSRLMRTLRSGSLVFRAGLFSEWFDERLEPYLHYLPVRLCTSQYSYLYIVKRRTLCVLEHAWDTVYEHGLCSISAAAAPNLCRLRSLCGMRPTGGHACDGMISASSFRVKEIYCSCVELVLWAGAI